MTPEEQLLDYRRIVAAVSLIVYAARIVTAVFREHSAIER